MNLDGRARVKKSERIRKPTARHKRNVRAKLFAGQETVPCHYCDKPLTEVEATLDHVIPRACGGGNSVSNFVVACFACNGRRGDMPYDVFRWLMKRSAA